MHYAVFDTPEGEQFIKAITKLRTPDEVAEFLSDVFTPSEARIFSARFNAAVLLDKRVPYMEIQKTTGLSSATIARVSQAIQFGTGGYRKILDRIKK